MHQKKKQHPIVKQKLHHRNKHRERYNFKQLIESCPELGSFVMLNKFNDESIDFSNPEAVLKLNKALLKHFYKIHEWNIPEGYLCPPIPGRADYIHYMADLLGGKNYGKIPTGPEIICLDIGVGANCIYPMIGHKEYGWSFIGSDIDKIAIDSARKTISLNPDLSDKIVLKLQENPKDFFYGVIRKENQIDLTVCNPPFHSTPEDAQSGTLRKLKNLSQQKVTEPVLNFGGQNKELCYEGGEKRFICKMIRQSKKFAESVFWFSSLVSKKNNLKNIYEELKSVDAFEVKTIQLGQGNKTSRIVAWTFLDLKQQKNWKDTRWK
ncbi:MAG: 23S rRNA (adenine(1618)-N(6))-methyltransferase RlmF [Bacteroidales bacterium]